MVGDPSFDSIGFVSLCSVLHPRNLAAQTQCGLS